MVDLVGGEDRAAARGRQRAWRGCARSTTSARRRSASTRCRSSTTASAAGRAATRSRSCARPRASTSSARSSCWPTATASSSRSRTRIPRRPSAAQRRARLHELLERTATFYVRVPVGVQGGRSARASTCSGAGCRRRRCARSASATRRRRGTRCSMRLAAGGLLEPASSTTPAWPSAAQRGADLRPVPRGASRSRWPTRAGGSSGSARGAMGDDQGRSTSTRPRASSSTSGRQVYARDLARAVGGEGAARSSSPRATRTSSRCTRPGSRTPSRSWARR